MPPPVSLYIADRTGKELRLFGIPPGLFEHISVMANSVLAG
jgi:hypothetical protein